MTPWVASRLPLEGDATRAAGAALHGGAGSGCASFVGFRRHDCGNSRLTNFDSNFILLSSMATSSSVTLDDGVGFDALICRARSSAARWRAAGPHQRVPRCRHAMGLQRPTGCTPTVRTTPAPPGAWMRSCAAAPDAGAWGRPQQAQEPQAPPLAVCCRQFATYFQERALEKLALVLAAGGDPRQTKDPHSAWPWACAKCGARDFLTCLSRRCAPGHADTVYQAVDMLLQAGLTSRRWTTATCTRRCSWRPQMGTCPRPVSGSAGANAQAAILTGSNALMYAAGDVDGLAQSRAGFRPPGNARVTPLPPRASCWTGAWTLPQPMRAATTTAPGRERR